MEDKEREALYTAFSTILLTLRQLEIKIDAAAETLADTHPDFHAKYQIYLDEKRKDVVNELSTTLEGLRKTFQKKRIQ